MENGYIYKGTHEGWYSISDETFYPATQVEEQIQKDGSTITVSKETGKVVEWTSEENYKFRLSKTQPQLVEWLTNNPKGLGRCHIINISNTNINSISLSYLVIVPAHQHATALKTLQAGPLPDLSISRPRSRLHWGIPVPNDPSHTM